jgi:ABC-2 type transport system ATP-binding protein
VVEVDMATASNAGVVDPTTMRQTAKLLAEQSYVRSVETIGATLRLYVENAASATPQIMRTLITNGIDPGGIESRQPSLDDVFLAKTGRSLEE